MSCAPAVRDLDMSNYVPFKDWTDYPIMAALSCRGCTQSCVICGGSAAAFKKMHGRDKPAFRDPELLAADVRRISRMSAGPVFILGDLRQPGREYARRFFDAMKGFDGPIITELFSPASREFLADMAKALPNFTLEVSLESHDPVVRHAFGKHYGNEPMERTLQDALDVGAQRLDVFFMSGLPQQTAESVLQTVDYCEDLVKRFGKDGRLAPFISPLAPFLDPGSRGYEEPEVHGYKLFAHTLEEHRRLLVAPSWKYVLNYETRWMDRHQLVDATYAAGKRLNRIKAEYGLVPQAQAAATEQRINWAVRLIAEIDRLMVVDDQRGVPARDGAAAARDRAREHEHRVRQARAEHRCEGPKVELWAGRAYDSRATRRKRWAALSPRHSGARLQPRRLSRTNSAFGSPQRNESARNRQTCPKEVTGMVKGTVAIETDRCKGCELCTRVCPQDILHMSRSSFNARGYRPVVLVDPDGKCTGCALCALMCPDVVLTVYRYDSRRPLRPSSPSSAAAQEQGDGGERKRRLFPWQRSFGKATRRLPRRPSAVESKRSSATPSRPRPSCSSTCPRACRSSAAPSCRPRARSRRSTWCTAPPAAARGR